MKRPGSTFHQLVQRIPADIAGRSVGMRLAIPVGDETADILITPDRKDALADLCEAECRTRRQDRLISRGYVRAALHEAVR